MFANRKFLLFFFRSKSSSVDQCRKATPPSTAAAPTMAYLERVIQTWDTWDTDRFQGKLCGQSHTPGSTVRGKRACSWLPACKICKNTTVLIPLLDFRKKNYRETWFAQPNLPSTNFPSTNSLTDNTFGGRNLSMLSSWPVSAPPHSDRLRHPWTEKGRKGLPMSRQETEGMAIFRRKMEHQWPHHLLVIFTIPLLGYAISSRSRIEKKASNTRQYPSLQDKALQKW